MSDIIEQAARVLADRMTDEDFAARGTDGAVFSEHDTRHLAQALADAGLLNTKAGHPRTEPTPEVELARQAIQAQMNRAGT